MHDDDFVWSAMLMQRRRERYATFSPVFWRPAANIERSHAEFMRSTAAQDGAIALRTDHAFAISIPHDGRCFVDDFAVDDDDRWATDGRALALEVWATASPQQSTLRVVTARRDEPKRTMLQSLGLTVTERWWVKELDPTGPSATWGPATIGAAPALIIPAPPVYDPGGPVCLLGDMDTSQAGLAATEAAGLGAVLAIVQRKHDPPATEPELEMSGYHNPSEFYEGDPTAGGLTGT
jgi:hypothetical protein